MFRQLFTGVTLIGLVGCSSPRAATKTTDEAQDAVLVSRAPEFREVTIAAGTVLPLTLESAVASNVNHVEDRVHARLSQPLVVGDMEVVPRGSRVEGVVSDVQRSGKVEGRARLVIKFNTLVVHDTPYHVAMSLTRVAPGTKKKDAEEIGIPAAGGAIVGALVGGKKGAGIGALVGGGAGTAYVLATPGQEVRLAPGARLSVRLAQAVTIRVPA